MGSRIKIYFKNGKSHSNQSAPNAISFFLDEKSNEQLIDLLVFSCNEHIIDNTSTTFELSFEGYTDKISRRFNKQDIENVIARFDKAKKFRSFSEYAFRQMGYIGVLESTEMIKHLGEKYSDLFNYKGDFWDLLYDYSVACENPKENPKSIYLFISFAGSMKVYDDRYGNSTYRDHMKYFLNECGYEEKLLDFTAVELIEFIGNKYSLNNTANKSK